MKRTLLVAALALAFSAGCRRKAAEAPPAPRAAGAGGGVWRSVSRGITPDGTVPYETALQAFAVAYGPVPGASGGAADSSVPFCGTETLRWIAAYAGRLNEAQRRAVVEHLRATRPPPIAAQLTWHQSAQELWHADWHNQDNFLHSFRTTFTESDYTPTPAERAAFDEALVEARALFDPLSGGSTPFSVNPIFRGSWCLGEPGSCFPGVGAEALVIPNHGGEAMSAQRVCHVRVGLRALRDLVARNPGGKAVLFHEIFHCYQYAHFPGTYAAWADAASTNPWWIEGAASWAGEAAVHGSNSPYARDWWSYYLSRQPWSLFGSQYDAIGFYETLARQGVDVWSKLLPLLNRQSNFARLEFMVDSGTSRLDAVTSAAHRNAALGAPWTLNSPLIPPDLRTGRAPQDRGILPRGNAMSVVAFPGQQQLNRWDFGDGVAFVYLTGGGIGRASFGPNREQTFGPGVLQMWCREPPCTCPDGSNPRGVPAVEVPRDAALVLAHTGNFRSDGEVMVRAMTREEACGAPDAAVDAPPPPGRCDPCLDGAWHIDKDNEREALRRVVPQATFNLRGDVTLRFACGDGSARGQYHRFCIDLSMPGAAGFTTRVIADGPVTARYRTEGPTFASDNVNIAATFEAGVLVGGAFRQMPIPFDRSLFTSVPSGSRYRCTADTLEFDIPTPNGTRLLRYRR